MRLLRVLRWRVSAVFRWHASAALGQPASDLYYRRVWEYRGAWQVVAEGPVRTLSPLNCTIEGPTWCSIAPPYLFERWWHYVPHTIGTGGTWDHAGDRQNWGSA